MYIFEYVFEYIHMPDKKYQERNIRKVTRNGGSLNVSIPVEILKKLNWREKQKVKVKREGSRVIISDWKPKRRKS